MGKYMLLKRRMNCDSFHIKQTYLKQKKSIKSGKYIDRYHHKLTCQSPLSGFKGTDKVFKVIEIRFLSVGLPPYYYHSHVLLPTRKHLSLPCNMKEILDNSPRHKNRLFHSWDFNKLKWAFITSSTSEGSAAVGSQGGSSRGLWGNLIDIYSSNDDEECKLIAAFIPGWPQWISHIKVENCT